MSIIRFFVKLDSGEVSGPVTAQELAQMALSGTIGPTCMIQREQGTSWHPASKVKGLVSPVPHSEPEVEPALVPVSPSPTPPRLAPPPIPRPARVAEPMSATVQSTPLPLHTGAMIETPPVPAAAVPAAGSTQSQIVPLATSLARATPLLLTRPINGVVALASAYSTGVPVTFAAIVNIMFSLVTAGSLCFVFRKWLEAGVIAEVLSKGVLTLFVPFAAIAAANFGIRKLVLPYARWSFGYDAVVSATAMWPVQIALAVMLLAGLSQTTVSVVPLSVLLAVLIIYAVNVTQSPKSPNLVLFLTPVQVAVAGVVANLLFEVLLSDIGKLFRMG